MEEIVLIDAHAHLEELEDLSGALSEAKSSGVKAIVAVGMDLDPNRRTLEIAQTNRGVVFPAIGYHPWKIKENEVEKNLIFIKDHVQECIALGEIGLDYKVHVKKDLQCRVFGEILDLAAEYDKPVILHCRFSHKRTYEMVVERGIRRTIFHWYSGPLDLSDKILESGYFISATPALAHSPLHQQGTSNCNAQGKQPRSLTIALRVAPKGNKYAYRGNQVRPQRPMLS